MRSLDIRRLYLYVVSFATLLMVIFSGVKLVRTALELALPPVPPPVPYIEPVPAGEPQRVPPEELKRRTEEEARRSRLETRRYTTIQMVESATMILIAMPLYLYHWRLARRDEANT